MVPDVSGMSEDLVPLENMQYDYNIRGWMLGMNRWFTRDETSPFGGAGGGYFGFDLGYDKTLNDLINNQAYDAAQYNGNISGTVWKSKGDGEKRKYDFAYDNANRLVKADFKQYSGGTFANDATVNYDMFIGTFDGGGATQNNGYDANGNILKLEQWGLKLTSSSKIDQLDYQYMNNNSSNKLLSVTENGGMGTTDNKLGDFTDKNTSNDDYTYDDNGNLTTDKNKNITGITYNILNLPVVVTLSGGRTVTYTYSAGGAKLKKESAETNATVAYNGSNYTGIAITTTSSYIGNAVFESKSYTNNATLNSNLGYSNKIQFAGHEEGRIRPRWSVAATPSAEVLEGFEYDYFIKDHLGNTRMLITEQVKEDTYPTLSLQGSSGSQELTDQNKIWEKADGTPFDVVAKRSSSPGTLQSSGMIPNPSTYSLLVRSSTGKIGAGKLLRVMSGDKIETTVQYYWSGNSGSTPTGLNTLLGSFASILANSAGALPAVKDGASTFTTAVTNDINAGSFFTSQGSSSYSNRPKAFLNVLFFNEQFKFDATASYTEQIGLSSYGQIVVALGSARHAAKNGYCYVYISNESDDMVYFDNFTLKHTRSAILEETHYYPFGLVMSGISSKAANITPNKEKTFQGQRFDDELDLNWVQFKWRNHDPQTGRFIEIDPLAEDYVYNSTYAFSENKVTNHIELEGLEAVSVGDPKQYLAEGFRQIGQAVGSMIDKVNIFKYEGEVHLNFNKNIEVKAGPVSSNTTVTVSENTASFKFGSFEDLFKYNKAPIEFKAESNTLSKVEVKNAVNATVNGVPLEGSQKTTIDGNGTKNTISAGPKAIIEAGKIKVDGSAQAFYSNQISGPNAGQQAVGVKMAVDATFLSKKVQIVNTPAVQVNISNQTKAGASLQWNFKWPQ